MPVPFLCCLSPAPFCLLFFRPVLRIPCQTMSALHSSKTETRTRIGVGGGGAGEREEQQLERFREKLCRGLGPRPDARGEFARLASSAWPPRPRDRAWGGGGMSTAARAATHRARQETSRRRRENTRPTAARTGRGEPASPPQATARAQPWGPTRASVAVRRGAGQLVVGDVDDERAKPDAESGEHDASSTRQQRVLAPGLGLLPVVRHGGGRGRKSGRERTGPGGSSNGLDEQANRTHERDGRGCGTVGRHRAPRANARPPSTAGRGERARAEEREPRRGRGGEEGRREEGGKGWKPKSVSSRARFERSEAHSPEVRVRVSAAMLRAKSGKGKGSPFERAGSLFGPQLCKRRNDVTYSRHASTRRRRPPRIAAFVCSPCAHPCALSTLDRRLHFRLRPLPVPSSVSLTLPFRGNARERARVAVRSSVCACRPRSSTSPLPKPSPACSPDPRPWAPRLPPRPSAAIDPIRCRGLGGKSAGVRGPPAARAAEGRRRSSACDPPRLALFLQSAS